MRVVWLILKHGDIENARCVSGDEVTAWDTCDMFPTEADARVAARQDYEDHGIGDALSYITPAVVVWGDGDKAEPIEPPPDALPRAEHQARELREAELRESDDDEVTT